MTKIYLSPSSQWGNTYSYGNYNEAQVCGMIAKHAKVALVRNGYEVKVGDKVQIVGIRETRETTVTGVEMFRKLLDYAQAGDNICALLRGIDRKDIERCQVLAKVGSIKPHTKFHTS